MSGYIDRKNPDTSYILIGCATCGDACAYPQEIGRASDGVWRCYKNGCYETLTVQDFNRMRTAPRRAEKQPIIPGAPLPSGRT